MRLAKFVSANHHLIQNLKNGQLYFNCPKNFNDPFEGVFRRKIPEDWEKFKKWHSQHFPSRNCKEDFKDKSTLDKHINKGNEYKHQNNGICCFSTEEKKTDILMWAHYGQNHLGLCLIFNFYSNKDFYQTEVGLPWVNYGPEKVHYVTEYLDERVESPEHFDDKSFWTTKYKIWKEEKEYRFRSTKFGLFNYNKEKLVEIIFGYRFEQPHMEAIKEIIQNDNRYRFVKFYKVNIEKGKFNFTLDEI